MSEATGFHNLPVEIMEAGGRYVCMIRPLLLTASADSLDAAYADVCAKRDRLIDEARDAGILDKILPAGGDTQILSRKQDANLGLFAIRTSIVAVAAGLVLLWAGAIASSTARKSADAVATRLETTVPFSRDWDRHAAELQDWLYEMAAARNQPTPAQEAKIRESVKILVARFKPYLDELAPIFEKKADAGNGAARTEPKN